MNWKEGRQGTGYRTLKLFESKRLRCDVYILHFPEGSYAPTHVDAAPDGYEHHRINVVVSGEPWRKVSGGRGSRVCRFRPDIVPHHVSVSKSDRWIFSVGWLRKAEQ